VPTTKRIVIAPRLVEQIAVDLAGEEYVIATPKATLGLLMADQMQAAGGDSGKILAQLQEWILATFGPKQGKKVWARLTDPADDLDIPQVVDLITQITEVATPNPTT
jgi:hypothetical protein